MDLDIFIVLDKDNVYYVNPSKNNRDKVMSYRKEEKKRLFVISCPDSGGDLRGTGANSTEEACRHTPLIGLHEMCTTGAHHCKRRAVNSDLSRNDPYPWKCVCKETWPCGKKRTWEEKEKMCVRNNVKAQSLVDQAHLVFDLSASPLPLRLLTHSWCSAPLSLCTIGRFISLCWPLTPHPDPLPRDPYSSHSLTFQLNIRSVKQHVQISGVVCVHSAHMHAHLFCISPFCSTGFVEDREYFQTTERQIKRIFPCHTVRALFSGRIPLTLHYCTLSALWNRPNKLHPDSEHIHLSCVILVASFVQVQEGVDIEIPVFQTFPVKSIAWRETVEKPLFYQHCAMSSPPNRPLLVCDTSKYVWTCKKHTAVIIWPSCCRIHSWSGPVSWESAETPRAHRP